MVWVDSPKFFCVTGVVNALVDADLPIPAYGAISALPATETGHPHNPESLTHIYCYMDDVISVVQGGGQSDNADSLAAQSVLSNGSSPCYPGKPRTWFRSRSSWPGREIGSVSRRFSVGS